MTIRWTAILAASALSATLAHAQQVPATPAIPMPSADAQVRQLLTESITSRLRLGPQAAGVRLSDGRRLNEALAACQGQGSGGEPSAAECIRVGLAVEKAGAGSGEALYTKACALGSSVGCELWGRSLKEDGFTDLAAVVAPSAERLAGADVRGCNAGHNEMCGIDSRIYAALMVSGGIIPSADACFIGAANYYVCLDDSPTGLRGMLAADTRVAQLYVAEGQRLLDASAEFTGNRASANAPSMAPSVHSMSSSTTSSNSSSNRH
jgi:hypothetical protein